jgi:hypothetical protein
MRDLDQAVSEWRRQMTAAGVSNPEVLDELESHLREDVEQQMRSGSNVQEAFDTAVERMGQASSLQVEFGKVGTWAEPAKPSWLRASLLGVGILSGIYYVGLVAYGLLKHDMILWQKVLGLSALGVTVVLALGSYYLCRRFLNTADPRIKKPLGYGSGALWIGWMLCFVFVILPRCELEIAGLVVAVIWAFAPGAALVGAGLGLEGRGSQQAAVR